MLDISTSMKAKMILRNLGRRLNASTELSQNRENVFLCFLMRLETEKIDYLLISKNIPNIFV